MAKLHKVKIPGGRSPAYPYISLRKALERAEEIRVAEGRNSAPITSFYKAWGLGEKSSGARQTMAALRYFGLIDHFDLLPGENPKLSERAWKIVMDKRPNSPERQGLIQDAALLPWIHKELWEKWGRELPSDTTVQYHLTVEHKFNERGAEALIAEYKDTLVFANLLQPGNMPDGGNADEEEGMRDSGETRSERGGMTSPLPLPPGIREERIIDDHENDIVIRFTGDLNEMYDFLHAYIDFKQERRKKTSGAPTPQEVEPA